MGQKCHKYKCDSENQHYISEFIATAQTEISKIPNRTGGNRPSETETHSHTDIGMHSTSLMSQEKPLTRGTSHTV